MSVPMPSAPLSPALEVTITGGNVQKYASKKKKVLNAEEHELFELAQAAGIVIDQEVFKIIADLLKMNVAPQAVFQTLKAMCAGQGIADTSVGDSSSASHITINTIASSEPRVRSKAGGSYNEKGRDGCIQKVPRQSSTNRGRKPTKSSGSSSSSSHMTSN